MPYIQPTRRPAFDAIIDGLVFHLRDQPIPPAESHYLEQCVRFIGCSALGITEPELGVPDMIAGITTDLVRRLKSEECVKGDVNYTLTRVVLETLKPANGWGYHPLSDAVSLLRDQADLTNLEYPQGRSWKVRKVISVFRDVADEIVRRLLGPYENKAIMKNGDMVCFQEPFAYMPPFLAVVEEIDDWPEWWPKDPPTQGCGGNCTCGKLPPIADALTDDQYDEAERAARKQG